MLGNPVSLGPVLLCLAAALTASLPLAAQTPTSDSPEISPLPKMKVLPDLRPSAEPFRHVSLTIFFENDGTFTAPTATPTATTPPAKASISPARSTLSPTPKPVAAPPTATLPVSYWSSRFTPPTTSPTPPAPDDRPYAGYLYGGLFYQRQSYNLNGIDTLDHVQLDLGFVGPSSLAEQSPSEVHRLTGDADPQGWDFQLGDEAQIQLNLRRQWRIDLLDAPLSPTATDHDPRWFDDIEMQLIPEVSLDVGTALQRTTPGPTSVSVPTCPTTSALPG